MSYRTLKIDISQRDRHAMLPHVCAIFREATGAHLESVVFDAGSSPKMMKVSYSGRLSAQQLQTLAFRN